MSEKSASEVEGSARGPRVSTFCDGRVVAIIWVWICVFGILGWVDVSTLRSFGAWYCVVGLVMAWVFGVVCLFHWHSAKVGGIVYVGRPGFLSCSIDEHDNLLPMAPRVMAAWVLEAPPPFLLNKDLHSSFLLLPAIYRTLTAGGQDHERAEWRRCRRECLSP